jgi:hypothetical protein
MKVAGCAVACTLCWAAVAPPASTAAVLRTAAMVMRIAVISAVPPIWCSRGDAHGAHPCHGERSNRNYIALQTSVVYE